jgi:micrococcal nuclease
MTDSFFIASSSLLSDFLAYLWGLIRQEPIYGLYITAAFLLLVLLLFLGIRYLLAHHDPLPKKLPNCVWHTTVRKLDRVYDGDTFYCYLNGHNPIDNKPVGIRVRGIDTPEIKDKNPRNHKKAQQAKDVATEELKKARTIHLYNVNLNDKYGRVLATVFCDGRDLAKILLQRRLAKKYDGGKKEEW